MLRKSLMIMADKKEELEQEQAAVEQPATEESPNRSRYAAMFAEDNPNIDFEDKEARYGRMAEERESYRNLSKAGKRLSENLNKNRWVAAMIQDMFSDESGELDPITWMYKNGIDVQKAMEDEEYRKGAVEGLNTWLQKQSDGEKDDAQKDENALQAQQNLSDLAEELNLSDEQCNRMWNYLFNDVIAPGMNFEVSKDTWQMILHAMNYDQDIANAREESAMQARNEKHANKVKTFEESKVPPSFSQGQAQRVAPREKKEESLADFVRRNT